MRIGGVPLDSAVQERGKGMSPRRPRGSDCRGEVEALYLGDLDGTGKRSVSPRSSVEVA
jgi:hypothetical protein